MEMTEEQGYASDSKLSMLASSLYNGMEGIEMNSEVRNSGVRGSEVEGSEVGSGEVDEIGGDDSEVVGGGRRLRHLELRDPDSDTGKGGCE